MNNVFINYYTIFRKTIDNGNDVHTDKWEPEPVEKIRGSVSVFCMLKLNPISDLVRR